MMTQFYADGWVMGSTVQSWLIKKMKIQAATKGMLGDTVVKLYETDAFLGTSFVMRNEVCGCIVYDGLLLSCWVLNWTQQAASRNFLPSSR